MKLTFKDLKQNRFTIDAEPSETIGDLKKKIAEVKDWEPSTQKLIYSGKILHDDNTIESYKVEEKGFIVCMTSKPKAAPAKAAEPATPSKSTSTPVAPAAPAQVPTSARAQVPSTPSPAPVAATGGISATPASFNDPSTLALGEQRAAAIANMESMGFQRGEIDRAMRAAFFNPDRAVEYLLTGIPENLQQEERPPAATTATSPTPVNTGAAQQQPRSDAAEPQADEPVNLFEQAAAAGRRGAGNRDAADLAGQLGGGQGGGERQAASALLNSLRGQEHFQQLRQVVQQQPSILEPILQQLAVGNPNLAQTIAENPEQFLNMLTEGGDGDVELPPGAQQIHITEEERDAIERLCRLGFERDLVIQAYFACDKNEELAANFLFDQPDEEHNQQAE